MNEPKNAIQLKWLFVSYIFSASEIIGLMFGLIFFVQRLKYDVTSFLSISCVFIEIECNSMLRLPNNALSASSIESPKSLLSSFFLAFWTPTSNMSLVFFCCCRFVKLLTHSKLLWNQRDTITIQAAQVQHCLHLDQP